MKKFLKRSVQGVFLVLALPLAAIAGFGSWSEGFRFSAQVCAQIHGILGDYWRIAFYRLGLKNCSLDSRIQYGSFFAHPSAAVGERVYVGANCVLGNCSVSARCIPIECLNHPNLGVLIPVTQTSIR